MQTFYACKTLKLGFFYFAVDTNLFRLESTDPKKDSGPWMLFGEGQRPPRIR